MHPTYSGRAKGEREVDEGLCFSPVHRLCEARTMIQVRLASKVGRETDQKVSLVCILLTTHLSMTSIIKAHNCIPLF